jgi:hypothetical protein
VRKWLWPMAAAVVAVGALLAGGVAVAESPKPEYTWVGSGTCRQCHGAKTGLNQYQIWESSPHARAWRTLGTSPAREIAARVGIIGHPGEARECLKCHTTGGGHWEKTAREGVGCESCHGPGSAYHTFSGHVDLRNRLNGYATAKRLGMYPVLDYEDNLQKRERLCLSCHTAERPCFPVDAAAGKRKRLTIQNIDELRRGYIKFSHPIGKY